MQRGEVWAAVWPNDPHKKERPVLIVSNDHRNHASHLADITVVKITSLVRADGRKKPVNQFEDLVLRFKKDSIVQCGALYSIEKKYLRRQLAQLSSPQMLEIDQRLRNVLGL